MIKRISEKRKNKPFTISHWPTNEQFILGREKIQIIIIISIIIIIIIIIIVNIIMMHEA